MGPIFCSDARGAAPAPILATEPIRLDEAFEWRPREAVAVRVFLRHAGSEIDDVPDSELVVDAGQAQPEAVTLTLTGPDGRPVALPWRRSGTANPAPLPLRAGNQSSMAFYLPADSTLVATNPPATLRLDRAAAFLRFRGTP